MSEQCKHETSTIMTVDYGFAPVEEVIQKLNDDEDWITVIDDAAFRLKEQQNELAALRERLAAAEAAARANASISASNGCSYARPWASSQSSGALPGKQNTKAHR